MARCVHCAKPISRGEETCPICGVEQPVEWMVKLVYVLSFLFIQGAVYRLIWPRAGSLLYYGIYFAATSVLAIALWLGWKRLAGQRDIPTDDHDLISD